MNYAWLFVFLIEQKSCFIFLALILTLVLLVHLLIYTFNKVSFTLLIDCYKYISESEMKILKTITSGIFWVPL